MDPPERDRALSRAWPAREERPIGPWLARLDAGVTRRANSVLAHGEGAGPSAAQVDSWLDATRALYEERGLVPWIQVTDASWPPGLEQELAARGWATEIDPTVYAAGPVPSAVAGARWRVDLQDTPPRGWVETWWESDRAGIEAERDAAAAILSRIEAPTAYAAVSDPGGACIGTALGVVVGRALVLECVATRPRARRQGVARAAIGAVAAWASTRARAPDRVLLAVRSDNEGARALYADQGLTEVGLYAYARPERR